MQKEQRVRLEAELKYLREAAAGAAAREAELRADAREARREAADAATARLEGEVRALLAAMQMPAAPVLARPHRVASDQDLSAAEERSTLEESRRATIARPGAQAPLALESGRAGGAPVPPANLSAQLSTGVGGASVGFAAFVSHAKADAAMEARYLQTELEGSLARPVFLDRCAARGQARATFHRPQARPPRPGSVAPCVRARWPPCARPHSDDLRDLNELRKHVIESKTIVLLQSKHVLTRPFCLIEVRPGRFDREGHWPLPSRAPCRRRELTIACSLARPAADHRDRRGRAHRWSVYVQLWRHWIRLRRGRRPSTASRHQAGGAQPVRHPLPQ